MLRSMFLNVSVLRKPERTFENGFQFHTHSAKGNILNEKKNLVKKCVFLPKITDFLNFPKVRFRHKSVVISIIKTVLHLDEPVRGGD